jgi:tetratricopeptide (TPR) repeat protein
MKRRILLLNALFVCLIALSPMVRADDVALTLPFENVSDKNEYNWIGESFAITLANLLNEQKMLAISTDERDLAYERLGLRASDILTRAAMIRIADSAQANLLVIGEFDIDDKRNPKMPMIAIKARVIEVREGRLAASKVFNLNGLLAKLQEMQGQLAWNILYERNPSLPYSKDELVRRSTSVPPRAYESFVKGIQTRDPKVRETFLKRSIQESEAGGTKGRFAQAIYELGLFYYRQRNFAEAARTLAVLTESDPRYLETQFYLGVSYAETKKYKESAAAYERLLKPLPLLEVWNNSGAALFASGAQDDGMTLLRQAVANSPYDPVYRFNFGYALWRQGRNEEAAEHLRVAISANPQDCDALYILSKSLRATGPVEEAKQMADEALKCYPEKDNRLAVWEVAPEQMPVLLRFKSDFGRAAYYKLERQQPRAANNTSAAAQPTPAQLLERAQQLSAANKDVEALAEIDRVLGANRTLAEAHLLKGHIYQRRREVDQAIAAYQQALSLNPRLVAAHVALGQIYLSRGDRVQALAHCNRAYEIDPQDREAIALRRQIETER